MWLNSDAVHAAGGKSEPTRNATVPCIYVMRSISALRSYPNPLSSLRIERAFGVRRCAR